MRKRSLLLPAALLAASISLLAVTPQFWENFSQEELLEGTLTRVSLSRDGKLSLAPAYDLFYDTGQPYVFSMVRDKSGNLYVGTGHEGKVFKIDPQGNGSVYYQSKELDIFALALDASGALYVATSPNGKVYKVTGADKATEFCDPEDKYIWSLAFDPAGNLYVGTAPRGIIYKVDRNGEKSTFYNSDDTHIMSLIPDGSGNLLAGTAPGGTVLEIDRQGKGFTLLDSPMEEIRSLAVDRFGNIFAVAASSRGLPSTPASKSDVAVPQGGPLPIATVQALSGLVDSSQDAKTTVSAPGGSKDASGAKSSIYLLSKTSGVETLYSSKEQLVYDVLIRGDGSVLSATGPKGRLLSIDAAKQVHVVTDSPEEQITRLLDGGDTTWAAGSNQGKIYRLQSRRAQIGTFESKVHDAKTFASWGKIAWRVAGSAGGTVELATRTGNTEKPDSSWSDWSAAYTTQAGQPITSPRARYLQWKASFNRGSGSNNGSEAEVLERVQIAYLQQNIRPQILSIDILPFGVSLRAMPSITTGTVSISTSGSSQNGTSLNSPRERGKDRMPLPPRRSLEPGAQAFTWKADDDNNDSLEYSLYFKGEGEADWKLLEKQLSDNFFTLDSDSLPDGSYTLKVVASDAPSNPFGKSLIGELVSRPFVISHATPLVEITSHKVQGKRIEAQFRSRVSAGRIASAEFSLDGGEWFLLFPVDGIADSPEEEFQLSTPELSPGEHLLGLRASDGNGNTGSARLVVTIR